jgi:hypothetical protein
VSTVQTDIKIVDEVRRPKLDAESWELGISYEDYIKNVEDGVSAR